MEIANPRTLRGRGPLESPSPNRSWLTSGFLRHTPVQDASTRTSPVRGGPSLATVASSEPPIRLRPNPAE